MTQLSNPFSPFVTALTSVEHGSCTIHGATHGNLGTVHTLGDTQYLRDEIGRHIGTIDHLMHGSATFHDGSGAVEGSAHDIVDTTAVTDKTGSTAGYII